MADAELELPVRLRHTAHHDVSGRYPGAERELRKPERALRIASKPAQG
ncbi:MAG TPA: hypothetical protein VGK73_04460 [Polyangiaceae bacterium]